MAMADGILSLLRNTTLNAGDSDEEIMKEVVWMYILHVYVFCSEYVEMTCQLCKGC